MLYAKIPAPIRFSGYAELTSHYTTNESKYQFIFIGFAIGDDPFFQDHIRIRNPWILLGWEAGESLRGDVAPFFVALVVI